MKSLRNTLIQNIQPKKAKRPYGQGKTARHKPVKDPKTLEELMDCYCLVGKKYHG